MMSDEDDELQSPSIVFQMHQSNAWQQYWSNISYILELGKKKKKFPVQPKDDKWYKLFYMQ